MPEGGTASAAIRELEAGRLESAREELDGLLLDQALQRARDALAAGSFEDALTSIDEALKLDPHRQETLLLKADASLRLAEAKIAAGGGSGGLIEGLLLDAIDSYKQSGESAHALFGASRAAWLLGLREEALALARRGLPLRVENDPSLSALLVPERVYADEVCAVYASARAQGSADAPALFRESEDALASVLGRDSDDPTVWGRLADLHEGEGQLAEAKATLERGLARAPEDAELLARLARVTRGLEGSAAAVATFTRYTAAHPEVAAGRWQLASARFQAALDGYLATPRVLDPAAFTQAEGEFRALAASGPEFQEGALGYEVVCRLARGWCAFQAGDLALARREFLSMNELRECGIEWSFAGALENGIQGLFYVADAYKQKEDNLAQGEVFETLFGLQPDSLDWSNNAGLGLRDAGEELEREGEDLCRAAHGLITNADALAGLRKSAGTTAPSGSSEERAAFTRAAGERFAKARELMERSWKAYARAAELAPDDVQVLNDAALILVYYLHRDLDLAEKLLRHAVELGGQQLEAKTQALKVEESPERASQLDTELRLLTSAMGDVHQSMGVLEWLHHKDAAAARTWFEKSLQIDPERPPPVKNALLPLVRGERALEAFDHWDLLHWAVPCDER